MKLITIFLVLIPALAFAGPFLVCDPQADVTFYDIFADGAPVVADHPAQPDGSLSYELTSAMPSVSFTAVAKNVWGASEPSDPYLSPSLATTPQNLRLSE